MAKIQGLFRFCVLYLLSIFNLVYDEHTRLLTNMVATGIWLIFMILILGPFVIVCMIAVTKTN